jgi:hypothetical protein
VNHFDGRERTYPVMYSHDPIGIVGDECQSVLYRMEARLTTIRQLVVYVKLVLSTELMPIVLLCLWEDEDDTQ